MASLTWGESPTRSDSYNRFIAIGHRQALHHLGFAQREASIGRAEQPLRSSSAARARLALWHALVALHNLPVAAQRRKASGSPFHRS